MAPGKKLKLLIWTSIPTHHQSAFLSAIRECGIDLEVHYYLRLSQQRRSLGWSEPQTLAAGERYVKRSLAAFSQCPDWRERVHILPGCGRPFLLLLALWLSICNVPWLHWSEASNPTHGLSFAKQAVRRFYGWLNKKRGLGALAIGDAARRDFIGWGIAAERIRYLPYSIAPLRTVRPSLGSASGSMKFLFVGALCRRKGIDVLLRSFALVFQSYPDAELKLVGRDDSRGEYEKSARALGIHSKVRFSPSVPAADVAEAIGACDVLVLPSRFDGWGMVLSEAASLGRALIATEACGAAHHLIRDGFSGYRVPAEDVEALAERMLRYCKTPQLAAQHGREAAAAFLELLPKKNVQRLRDAIEDLRGRAAHRLAI